MGGDSSESTRDLKYNVKDLCEEGNKYEVRFFHKMSEETKEDKEEESEEKEEEVPPRILYENKPTIEVDPRMTTKIEYYEPEKKKKKRNWFSRYFMCCA